MKNRLSSCIFALLAPVVLLTGCTTAGRDARITNPNQPGPAVGNAVGTAVGAVGTSSELTLEGLMLNEGGISTTAENGRVTVTEATPNEVSISGKLLTAIGQGVPNTRVTLTGINGGSRTVISTSFGFYEFGNVEPGQTYTLTVDGRRVTFAPVTVSVSNNLTHLDLIAQP